jgi:hypothetical protein
MHDPRQLRHLRLVVARRDIRGKARIDAQEREQIRHEAAGLAF